MPTIGMATNVGKLCRLMDMLEVRWANATDKPLPQEPLGKRAMEVAPSEPYGIIRAFSDNENMLAMINWAKISDDRESKCILSAISKVSSELHDEDGGGREQMPSHFDEDEVREMRAAYSLDLSAIFEEEPLEYL